MFSASRITDEHCASRATVAVATILHAAIVRKDQLQAASVVVMIPECDLHRLTGIRHGVAFQKSDVG